MTTGDIVLNTSIIAIALHQRVCGVPAMLIKSYKMLSYFVCCCRPILSSD